MFYIKGSCNFVNHLFSQIFRVHFYYIVLTFKCQWFITVKNLIQMTNKEVKILIFSKSLGKKIYFMASRSLLGRFLGVLLGFLLEFFTGIEHFFSDWEMLPKRKSLFNCYDSLKHVSSLLLTISFQFFPSICEYQTSLFWFRHTVLSHFHIKKNIFDAPTRMDLSWGIYWHFVRCVNPKEDVQRGHTCLWVPAEG